MAMCSGPDERGAVIGQDDGVGPGDIRGEFRVGDVAVHALDQVRVRAAGDGLDPELSSPPMSHRRWTTGIGWPDRGRAR